MVLWCKIQKLSRIGPSIRDFLSDALHDTIINWHHGVIIKLPQCCFSLDNKQFWSIYFKAYYAVHVMEIWDVSDKSIVQELILYNGESDV